MLVKTKINNEQKYVKITEPSMDEFLNSAFLKFSILPVSEGVRVFDETGTEIDADVFEEVVQQPNAGLFTIRFNNDVQGSSSADCDSGANSSTGYVLLDVVTSSPLEHSANSSEDSVILEMTACSSDDTIILDEELSPARKRQKADDHARVVIESALKMIPG